MSYPIVLSEGIRTARKDYNCDASVFIHDAWNDNDIKHLETDEIEAYYKAKATKFKIKKGDKYFFQGQIFDERKCTFRAIPEMNGICMKYDLYPTDY